MPRPTLGLTSRSASGVQTAAAWSWLPVWRERWWAVMEAERAALPLWLPVAFAAGVALWFGLPWQSQRLAGAVLLAGLGLAGLLVRWRPLALAALLALAGMGVAQVRSASVAHPVLAAPQVVLLTGTVRLVTDNPDRDRWRMTVAPANSWLPALVRISLTGAPPAGMAPGAQIRVRAMLRPPAGAAIPGGYDFARRAWFDGVGASGFPLGSLTITAPAPPPQGLIARLAAARLALTRRIRAAVPGEAGAIAAAFVTGDQGAIPEITKQAMRDSGLAHLLSISGLHIAVVVGGTLFLMRRLLALSPWLALRLPVRTIAAAAAALVGIGYTLLAGAEVPTVRTILATLIVLVGMVIGREAFSLRLLAAAAMLILALRPEALLGASFQLSFAAVIAIVALYESSLGRWLTVAGEDEGPLRALWRHFAGMLVSGLVAELALASIGLFHFNRTGLYGVFANLFAIPWTSFVIMPALMLALLAEIAGIGALVWPLVGKAMTVLVSLAQSAAATPGAIVRLPMMPVPAYALIITGGLWLALWRTRWRWWGGGVMMVGFAVAFAASPPDLLITGDGRNAALRLSGDRLGFIRPRTGDFLRDVWGDALAADGDVNLVDLPGTACSRDACVGRFARGGRDWRLLITLSRDYIDRPRFEAECARADIIVSDRRLPHWCRARWQVFDRTALAKSGAVAIWLDPARIIRVNDRAGDHPWRSVPALARRGDWQSARSAHRSGS